MAFVRCGSCAPSHADAWDGVRSDACSGLLERADLLDVLVWGVFAVAELVSVRFNTAEAKASSSFIGVRINETVQATDGCSCRPGPAGSCGRECN
jgi:hypothetical protein